MSKYEYMMLKFIDYNLLIFFGKDVVCGLPTFPHPDHNFYEQDILGMMMIRTTRDNNSAIAYR